MSWASKALKKEQMHRKIEQAMKDPRFQKEREEEKKQYTMNAFACFCLIAVDFLFREHGFKKKRVMRFLEHVAKSMDYIIDDPDYFRLLNEALQEEISVDTLNVLGLEIKWESDEVEKV